MSLQWRRLSRNKDLAAKERELKRKKERGGGEEGRKGGRLSKEVTLLNITSAIGSPGCWKRTSVQDRIQKI